METKGKYMPLETIRSQILSLKTLIVAEENCSGKLFVMNVTRSRVNKKSLTVSIIHRIA
jgi:hypothetical protein